VLLLLEVLGLLGGLVVVGRGLLRLLLLLLMRLLVVLVRLLGLLGLGVLLGGTDAEEPVEENGDGDVEDDVDEHETEVAPALGPVDVDAREELVGDAELAVLAVLGGVWLEEVAWAAGVEVGLHPLLAGGGSAAGLEDTDFVARADDSSVVEHGGGHARNPVGERRYAVHEDPEPGESGWALHDTVEDQGHTEQQGDNSSSRLRIRKRSNDHMREGRCVDEQADTE